MPPLEPHSRFSVQSNNSCFHWLGSPCRFLSEISCTELTSVEGEKRKLFWVLLSLLGFFKYIFLYTVMATIWVSGSNLDFKKTKRSVMQIRREKKNRNRDHCCYEIITQKDLQQHCWLLCLRGVKQPAGVKLSFLQFVRESLTLSKIIRHNLFLSVTYFSFTRFLPQTDKQTVLHKQLKKQLVFNLRILDDIWERTVWLKGVSVESQCSRELCLSV